MSWHDDPKCPRCSMKLEHSFDGTKRHDSESDCIRSLGECVRAMQKIVDELESWKDRVTR